MQQREQNRGAYWKTKDAYVIGVLINKTYSREGGWAYWKEGAKSTQHHTNEQQSSVIIIFKTIGTVFVGLMPIVSATYEWWTLFPSAKRNKRHFVDNSSGNDRKKQRILSNQPPQGKEHDFSTIFAFRYQMVWSLYSVPLHLVQLL